MSSAKQKNRRESHEEVSKIKAIRKAFQIIYLGGFAVLRAYSYEAEPLLGVENLSTLRVNFNQNVATQFKCQPDQLVNKIE